MSAIWNGILVGLALAILIGPILFSLLQRSIEQGRTAGFWVASGIWISDLLFILGVSLGVSYIQEAIQSPLFEPILAIFGGVVLIAIGVGMFISKPKTHLDETAPLEVFSSRGHLWLEGFLINTINPFSVIFWTSLITTRAADAAVFGGENVLFLGAAFLTIVATDTIKILLADRIRQRLQQQHILVLRKISGVTLFVFGLMMMVRGVFF